MTWEIIPDEEVNIMIVECVNRLSRPMLGSSRHLLQHMHSGGTGCNRNSSLKLHAGRDVDFADRAVASLPYLVPLFDGLKYGELARLQMQTGCVTQAVCFKACMKIPMLSAW